MISRHWRGLAKASSAEAYVQHLRSETLPALAAIAGVAGASILRRALADGVEFVVVTQWDSLDAIHAFAGRNAEDAVVPAQVQAMMVEYDRVVRHYEVVA
jgi:heme-degrading monooxygenase HmoA